MKIIYGDLFDPALLDASDGLCITTNSVIKANGLAVMGAGVAKVAAQMYPQLPLKLATQLKMYGNICQVFDILPRQNKSPLHIIAFPTKHHWKDPSSLALISISARQLRDLADEHGWKNIILPPPGCGLGQLSFKQVEAVISQYLDERFTVVFLKK